MTLSDVIPDIEPAMKSKNPQVKEGTLKFLSRCLATSSAPIQAAQVKPVSEALAALLEDGFEGARNEAATCLGTLMRMVGERPLTAVMEGLADVRKVKVKEAYDKATVKCTSTKTAHPRPAPKASAQPPKAVPPKTVHKQSSNEDEVSGTKESASKPAPKAVVRRKSFSLPFLLNIINSLKSRLFCRAHRLLRSLL